MEPPCLELIKVSKKFGGLTAVNEVSFTVNKGETVSIIGPNGAGKTSIFNIITGVYSYSGKVLFQGIEIMGKNPHEIASLGISRTFQNGGLFKEMTVLENVMLGLHGEGNMGLFSPIFKFPFVKNNEEERIKEKSIKELRNFNLETKSEILSANLPYGEQKLVELARAIIGNPKLLLLDEPGAGLNETEKEELIKHIQSLKNKGMTILLVEHHMDMVMRISDKIIVLNFGNKIAEGYPEEIIKHPEVIDAYLGKDLLYAGDS